MKLRDALTRLAVQPQAPIDLARVALLIARDAYRRLRPRHYLAQIERLAATVRPRLTGSLAARTAAFSAFLFDECGFRGNTRHYYDPRNSYLNKVLDRQVGLPIALAVLAMAVGARAGLKVVGVGLPGHFIAKAIKDDEAILFDPFHGGRFLDADACEKLVRAVTGQPFALTPAALEPASPRAIVARMLHNLKAAYVAARAYRSAARVTDRLTQLWPNDPEQQRDLGVLWVQAGRYGRAITPLRHYLAARPTAEDADDAQRYLRRALVEVSRWN
ncbi:MAG: transglutaminase-like domain-containing protein [Gemmataceae bacterium]|nr:transglutaminase-like domain-containing protein [Gemmata sp.]MDW8197432.1 transglutaminase-like domain-containing protein [Gemmataceae bacterium]